MIERIAFTAMHALYQVDQIADNISQTTDDTLEKLDKTTESILDKFDQIGIDGLDIISKSAKVMQEILHNNSENVLDRFEEIELEGLQILNQAADGGLDLLDGLKGKAERTLYKVQRAVERTVEDIEEHKNKISEDISRNGLMIFFIIFFGQIVILLCYHICLN